MRKFIQGHATFRSDYVAAEKEFLRRLASQGQSPDAMFIGCSDSRVVPELLTTSSPGDLFVVRNVANAVPPLENVDSSVGAALDYATVHLRVPHIIVCGHYGCGGVKAALRSKQGVALDHADETPSLVEWLQNLASGIDAQSSTDAEEQWRSAVEDNVLAQLAHLTTFACVRERLQSGSLQLHGWVYDIYAHGLKVYDAATDSFVDAGRLL